MPKLGESKLVELVKFDKCTFERLEVFDNLQQVEFNNTGIRLTQFTNNHFVSCKFGGNGWDAWDTVVEFCCFSNVVFTNCIFGHAMFDKCEFNNCTFNDCSISSMFRNTEFNNTTVINSRLFCKIDNSMGNIVMVNSTMKYAEFDDVSNIDYTLYSSSIEKSLFVNSIVDITHEKESDVSDILSERSFICLMLKEDGDGKKNYLENEIVDEHKFRTSKRAWLKEMVEDTINSGKWKWNPYASIAAYDEDKIKIVNGETITA